MKHTKITAITATSIAILTLQPGSAHAAFAMINAKSGIVLGAGTTAGIAMPISLSASQGQVITPSTASHFMNNGSNVFYQAGSNVSNPGGSYSSGLTYSNGSETSIFGSAPGTNFAYFDLNDTDNIGETIVEFNFGPSLADTSDDVIVSYYVNESGTTANFASLTATGHLVPEPSTALLSALSALLLFRRRR